MNPKERDRSCCPAARPKKKRRASFSAGDSLTSDLCAARPPRAGFLKKEGRFLAVCVPVLLLVAVVARLVVLGLLGLLRHDLLLLRRVFLLVALALTERRRLRARQERTSYQRRRQ